MGTNEPVDPTADAGGPAVATVVACPDGPLLLRGDVRVRTDDGTEITRNRRTVALCRCGKSGIAPWCDGTHKLVRFRAPAVQVAPDDLDPSAGPARKSTTTPDPVSRPGDEARPQPQREDPCAHRRPAGR